MDMVLHRAAELNFEFFFMGKVHLDKDRNGGLQVKRHASGKERRWWHMWRAS